MDRVGFPKGLSKTFVKLYTFPEPPDPRGLGQPDSGFGKANIVYNFPYGSIILFESYS